MKNLDGPLVSVCVAVYRRHDAPNVMTLAQSLSAALQKYSAELVVALNGVSPDEAAVPDGALCVDLRLNRGVAPGWNAAARESSGQFLVFANDDATPRPGSLDLLVDALEANPRAGVVGPTATRWDIPNGRPIAPVQVDAIPSGQPFEAEVVDGYLFSCRRPVFEELGGFDEGYAPASWEEIDFCTAARSAGYSNYAIAGCQVDHEYGISKRQPPWKRVGFNGRSELLWSIHRRNRRLFLSKWSGVQTRPVESS